MNRLMKFILDPYPIRSTAKTIIQRLELGGYEQRVQIGAVERPHYAYCIYHAAKLAKSLGYKRISVLEFGVAGGNGLMNLEHHAKKISELYAIGIDVYGFDTGEGLPKPLDYRDLPYQWKEGFFKMDSAKLKSKLINARLVLGNIEQTGRTFFEEYNPAPIGAIMYDFDFYSSTVAALKMLEAAESCYLPRVFCYFDDTIGTEIELYNDYTGVRMAINEFNEAHPRKKFGVPYHLLAKKVVEPWFHQIWIYHCFDHSRYCDFVSEEEQQLPFQYG
jgi:hypothetical protein